MATVNFSVPEEVKQTFNETFKGKNKSAIVAELMLEAVEREKRRKQHVSAIDRILERRKQAPALTDDEIHAARKQGRA